MKWKPNFKPSIKDFPCGNHLETAKHHGHHSPSLLVRLENRSLCRFPLQLKWAPPLPVSGSFEKPGYQEKVALGAAEKENWLKTENDFQASLLVCWRQIKSSWVLLCPAWNLPFILFFVGFILREMLRGGDLWFQRRLQACAHTA